MTAATQRFLTIINGLKYLINAIAKTVGAADAFKIISTNSQGRLDPSFLADDSVTLTKLQNFPSNCVIGRFSSGTGDPGFATIGSGLRFDSSVNELYVDFQQFFFDASQITTGVLPIGLGGTGLNAIPTAGNLLIGNGTNYVLGALINTDNKLSIEYLNNNLIINLDDRDFKQFVNNTTLTTTSTTYVLMAGMSLTTSVNSKASISVKATFYASASTAGRRVIASIFVNGVENTSSTVSVRLASATDLPIVLEQTYPNINISTTFEIRWRIDTSGTLTCTKRTFVIQEL